MKMKKRTHKLFLSTQYDFSLIGIVTQEKDYKISWEINKLLGIELSKSKNLDIDTTKKDIIKSFTTHTYLDNDLMITYNLISNKCENGVLLNQFKNIDFLFKIDIENNSNEIIELINKIKFLQDVISVFEINISELKEKQKQYLIL
jgi:hypothetical protein